MSSTGGQQKRLRVSAGDRRAVLEAFKPWVHLCHEACEAELPHFHLFSSMSVLDLRSGGRLTDDRYACLQRLAVALQVDEQGLVSEFDALRPVAMAFREQQDCTSRDAWKQAFRRSKHLLLWGKNMKPRIWPLCFKRMPAGPPLALAWSKLFQSWEEPWS